MSYIIHPARQDTKAAENNHERYLSTHETFHLCFTMNRDRTSGKRRLGDTTHFDMVVKFPSRLHKRFDARILVYR